MLRLGAFLTVSTLVHADARLRRRPLRVALASNSSALLRDATSASVARAVPAVALDAAPAPLTTLETARAWCELLAPDAPLLLVSVAAALAGAYVQVRIPSEVGRLIDVFSDAPSAERTRMVAHLFGWVGLGVASSFTSMAALHAALENATLRLKRRLFRALLAQDLAVYDARGHAALLYSISVDCEAMRDGVKSAVARGAPNVALIALGARTLMQLSPKLTLALFALLPVTVVVGGALGDRLRRLSKRVNARHAASNELAGEALANVRTVRAFDEEAYVEARFADDLARGSSLARRFGVAVGAFNGLTTLVVNAAILGTLAYGGTLVSSGLLSGGDLTNFLFQTLRVTRALQNLAVLRAALVKAATAADGVFGYTRRDSALDRERRKPSLAAMPRVRGDSVRFERVGFAYAARPDTPVLDDISLELRANKTVALVGETGSGKSTLAALLLGLYEPTSGRIVIDELDTARIDRASMRRALFAVVSQEPVLFRGSIEENIRFGCSNASRADVERAARAAHAHDFIAALPRAYDENVTSLTLSGGQKQRLAIARALLRNPRILVLDESTSSLDANVEADVAESLQALTSHAATLVIAHRLSTIQSADEILVLEKGRIVERGRHDELLKRKGKYAHLVQNQIKV